MSELATLRERLGLVIAAYVHRAGFALLAAIGPGVLAARISGSWPGGDAELFAPGGVIALETQRFIGRALPAVGAGTLAALSLAVLTGALPLGALLDGFARRGRLRPRDVADGATRALGTVVALLGAGFLAELLAGAVFGGASLKAIEAMHLGTSAETVATAGVVVATLLVVAAVGVVRDLACAAAVVDGRRFGGAVVAAWESLRPGLAWSYLWRAAASLAVVAAGAVVGALLLPALFHQIAVFGVVLLHASWLRVCVGTVRSGVGAAASPASVVVGDAG